MGTKGPRQHHTIHAIDAEFVHQQPRAGIERGLGHLDLADIAVCDGDLAFVVLPNPIGIGPPIQETAVTTSLLGRADQARPIQNTCQPHLGHQFDNA